MQHRMPVFDGDGHVLETDDQLDAYYEGRWQNPKRLAGTPCVWRSPLCGTWEISFVPESRFGPVQEGHKPYAEHARG